LPHRRVGSVAFRAGDVRLHHPQQARRPAAGDRGRRGPQRERTLPGGGDRLRLSADAGALARLTGQTARNEAHMQLGLVGLGKMGFNMRERLRAGGHEVIGYDPRPEVTDVPSPAALTDALTAPRVVWVMVPSGSVTHDTIVALADVLSPGDLLIDGGNSRYTEDAKHQKLLGENGISFIDA